MTMKICFFLSLIAIMLGIIGWIVNPIGVLLSIYLLNKKGKYAVLLLVLNLVMVFSFMPMWFLGDLFNF